MTRWNMINDLNLEMMHYVNGGKWTKQDWMKFMQTAQNLMISGAVLFMLATPIMIRGWRRWWDGQL